jgi:hypothetical protein
VKAWLLAVVACLAWAVRPAQAAISVDARATGAQSIAAGANVNATTATWTHTVGALSANSILIVVLAQDSGALASSVVWDQGGTNVALTRKGSATTGSVRVEIWFLKNPSPQGAKSVRVTVSPSAHIIAGSASFDGVDQATTFNAASPQTATGASGTNPSLAVTTTSGEWAVNVAVQDLTGAGGTPTKNASDNYIFSGANTVSGTIEGGGSDRSASGSSVTQTWTMQPSTGAWAQVGVSLLPSAGGGPTCVPTLGLLGVSQGTCGEALP